MTETIIEVDCSTGEQIERDMTAEEEEALAAARVVVEPPPTKNEILSLMLADVEPGDEGTTILWIVMQEMLQP